MSDAVEVEEHGSHAEQVVARRLSRADKKRERALWTPLTMIAVALYVLSVEVFFMIFLLLRIVRWMNGEG